MSEIKTLNDLRFKYGTRTTEWCSDEEDKKYLEMVKSGQDLPENIFQDDVSKCYFYKVVDCYSTNEEKVEYLKYKEFELIEEQTKKINTIRKISVFYFVCGIIAAVGMLLTILGEL